MHDHNPRQKQKPGNDFRRTGFPELAELTGIAGIAEVADAAEVAEGTG
jgi:hypothetical protein